MKLPDGHHVHGVLRCYGQLNEVAEIVRDAMSLTESEIYIKVSMFDGAQTLLIRTVSAEFEAYLAGADGELVFNGSVAGSVDDVSCLTQKVHGMLNSAGFAPSFEVYDEALNCVAAFNA